MKKKIAQMKEKCDEMLMKIGYATMDWAWWQWTLYYVACFLIGFVSFGTVFIIASIKGAKA